MTCWKVGGDLPITSKPDGLIRHWKNLSSICPIRLRDMHGVFHNCHDSTTFLTSKGFWWAMWQATWFHQHMIIQMFLILEVWCIKAWGYSIRVLHCDCQYTHPLPSECSDYQCRTKRLYNMDFLSHIQEFPAVKYAIQTGKTSADTTENTGH